MQTDAPLHIRVPKSLKEKIKKHMTSMRRKDAMANLSDAIRDLIERGLKK